MQTAQISKPTIELTSGVQWVNECYPMSKQHIHVSVYLIRVGDNNIVIDSGSFYHRESIRERLREAAGTRGIGALILSHADYDHGGNVAPILDEWENVEIIASSGLPEILGLPPDATKSVIGESMEIFGRRFSFIDPPLADRSHTAWIYDHEEGVLFTSDGFGNHHSTGMCDLISRDIPDGISSDDIYDFHRETLVFLRYFNPDKLRSTLESLFDTFHITYIAPVHGNPIAREDLNSYLDRLIQSVIRMSEDYTIAN